MGEYDSAAAQSDESKRASLSALAQAGTAGQAAFDQGQAMVQAQRQAATSQALGKAQLIGGAEAFSPSFQATAQQPYQAASSALGASAANFSGGLAAQRLANANYMAQVKAAIPIEQANVRAVFAARQAKAAASISDSKIKGQFGGAAENAIDAERQKNTAEFNMKNRAAKATKAEADRLMKIQEDPRLQKLKKDEDFFNQDAARQRAAFKVSANPRSPVNNADAQRRLNVDNQQLAKLTKQRVALGLELDPIRQAQLQQGTEKSKQAQALSAEVEKLRGRQPAGYAETARQKAIAAGIDPDRARGLFPNSLDEKAAKETHPLAYSYAKKFNAPLPRTISVLGGPIFKKLSSDAVLTQYPNYESAQPELQAALTAGKIDTLTYRILNDQYKNVLPSIRVASAPLRQQAADINAQNTVNKGLKAAK